MGICWGDPHNPTPTRVASLKSRMKLTISPTSSETPKKTLMETKETFPAHEQILEKSGLTVFTLTQLKEATQDFGGASFLGEEGFWEVSIGSTTSGSRESLIVVKRLKQGILHGIRECLTEIIFLSRLSHPNIVKLLGYCYENKELLLVYEFVSKGSLSTYLYGEGSIAHPLLWDRRLKIAIGAARGLALLHTYEHKIIYCDVTPANILLDESYTAKLTDFGLARFGHKYLATGHRDIKSNVYSFGVVLLELLMGRPVIDLNLPEKEQNLVIWSRLHLPCKENLVAMMDPKLKGNYSLEAVTEVAKLALKCVDANPHQRPSMAEVVEELEKIEAASVKSG